MFINIRVNREVRRLETNTRKYTGQAGISWGRCGGGRSKALPFMISVKRTYIFCRKNTPMHPTYVLVHRSRGCPCATRRLLIKTVFHLWTFPLIMISLKKKRNAFGGECCYFTSCTLYTEKLYWKYSCDFDCTVTSIRLSTKTQQKRLLRWTPQFKSRQETGILLFVNTSKKDLGKAYSPDECVPGVLRGYNFLGMVSMCTIYTTKMVVQDRYML
jgi:hypothetical protein